MGKLAETLIRTKQATKAMLNFGEAAKKYIESDDYRKVKDAVKKFT